MSQIKANNIDLIDAKPNSGVLGPSEPVNIAVRYLKDERFYLRLQIISIEVDKNVDWRTVVPQEEFKKIGKKQMKSDIIEVRKEELCHEDEKTREKNEALP